MVRTLTSPTRRLSSWLDPEEFRAGLRTYRDAVAATVALTGLADNELPRYSSDRAAYMNDTFRKINIFAAQLS